MTDKPWARFGFRLARYDESAITVLSQRINVGEILVVAPDPAPGYRALVVECYEINDPVKDAELTMLRNVFDLVQHYMFSGDESYRKSVWEAVAIVTPPRKELK